MAEECRITLAQINTIVGDFAGNTAKIIESITRAHEKEKADVIVFPELALCGYSPEDLLLRSDFYERVNKSLNEIKKHSEDFENLHIILGYPMMSGKKRYNAAGVIHQGEIKATYYKQHLPNYDVFDEKRYFSPGHEPFVYTVKNMPLGILICEDLWNEMPYIQSKNNGARFIIGLNSSPFDINKAELREETIRKFVKKTGTPVLYVNNVGAQDELVFDGGSFVMNAKGFFCQRAPYFEETLMTVPIDALGNIALTECPPESEKNEQIYQALVLGVRDYINKNNFNGALIGLSGGIDSALTLAIAVDALGAENVEAISMPSRYTQDMSNQDAKEQAEKMGATYRSISIEPIFDAYLTSLKDEFKDKKEDATEENLQSRARGNILMAISNKFGKIVLTTGNKSEMAVGYATLYGDMAGGFAVLKDISKTLVYELAKYRNTVSDVIPTRVIEREPSAELRNDQKDADSLPPYDILDAILERYIEKAESPAQIIAAKFDATLVHKIVKMVNNNEYKRRQAPPGIKISSCAFGKDRRYPITSKFDKE